MTHKHGGNIYEHKNAADFSANINFLGMPDSVRRAALDAIDASIHYPEPGSKELRQILAKRENVSEDQVICGNGAAELMFLLAQSLQPKYAVLAQPCFFEYEQSLQAVDCQITNVWLRAENGFELTAEFVSQIPADADMVILGNPNNPTGRLVDPSVIDAAACRCEQVGALLVVDECFLGFAPDARERSVAARAACSRHVAVLSAFTKLYGMAGLRLGYLISGNAQLIEGIRRAGQAWPVSSVAEAAGIAALEDVEYVSRTRDVLAGERAWLSHELSSLGLSVVPSDANFLLVRTPAKDIPERLYKQGVLVRTCDSISALSRFWCRVAVRTRKENARLAMAFSRALRAEGASGEGEPDERGGASCSGAMAGADGRGSAKEVDTRG